MTERYPIAISLWRRAPCDGLPRGLLRERFKGAASAAIIPVDPHGRLADLKDKEFRPR